MCVCVCAGEFVGVIYRQGTKDCDFIVLILVHISSAVDTDPARCVYVLLQVGTNNCTWSVQQVQRTVDNLPTRLPKRCHMASDAHII